MDRQYLRTRMNGAGTVVSDDRYGSRASDWPETDRESSLRSQPAVKSILRKPLKLQTRPRRNSDSSVTSNLPAVGSDSEMGGPSTPPLPTSSGSILPRKVLKAKFPGAIPEERRGVINLRSSRASATSLQSASYHVPPVRTVLSPSYVPDNRQLDHHDHRISRERNERHGYNDRDAETESISESSELSTTTQATTVASALSDFEGSDVTPTEAPTKSSVSQVRFTPSVIGSTTSSVTSSPPRARVKPRLGPRARAPSEAERSNTSVKSNNGRSVNIKLLPPSPATSGELKTQTPEKTDRSLVHKIEQLEAEARGLRVSQARLERELEDSSSAISASGKEKEAAVKERDQERSDKAELLNMLQEQTAIMDEYRSNLELQKGMLDEVEKERDAERAAKQELQAQLDANKKLLDEFSRNFEVQKGMIKEAEKERDEIKEAKDKADVKYAVLQEDLKTFRQERKAQEDDFIQQVVALQIIKETLESASDNKTKEIVDLCAERDKLRDEVAALTDGKKAAEDDAQKAKVAADEEHQALKAQIDNLQKAKEELEGIKSGLEGEKADLETRLDTAQGEITVLNARIEELEASATEFNAKMAGKEEEITKLLNEAADLLSRIDGLESDKAGLQKQVEDLEAEKTKTQAELHNLETDLAGSKAANVSIATSKLEVQESLDYARADIGKLTSEKAALQAEADKVPGLEGAKVELEAKIAELDTKIGELQAEADKVPGLSTEKDEASGKAAELESKIAELESKISDREAKISDREAKISELQAEADKVSSLTEAKSSLEAQLAEVQAKVATLQSELDKDPDTVVAALKAEIEANKQEIARRVEELSSLTDGNSTLSTQLGAAQQQLVSVQSSLDTVTASYNTSTEQVIELQAKVEQLQLQASSSGLRSRRGSRSRNSSPQKKEGRDKKDKQLVVVRNPTDRGAVAVMLQIVGGM